MIIVFLTRRFYPYVGGVESHVFELSRELVKRGHKITIITEETPKKTTKELDTKTLEGIDVLRINTGSDNWFKKFRIWRNIFKLRKILDESDIVHCHDVFFWYAPFRFLFPNKKVFTTFHGYETVYPPSKKAVFVRKLSEKLSNGNICIGEYISKWYGTKYDYIIYGGIEEPAFKSQILNSSITDKPTIVLIGRLEKDIGVSTYLKSLDDLKKDKINFKFLAYGEGAYENQIKKYGNISGFTNANKALKDSDIVFVSSYLLILQALALRKVVIAVFENPLKEDYLKLSPFSEFIYICKNNKEVVSVVKSITSDPWKSNSMLEKGYVWAKKQTWEAVANTYLKLWKK